MTPDTRVALRAWLVVALLWFVAFINFLDRTMLTTMHGSLVRAIPMTEAQFGLLSSVFLWVYGAILPFAGFLADRFSRRRVIIGSLFAWSVTTCLTAYATTYAQLLGMRLLLGISESCYVPAGLALIADYHRGPTRTLAMGVHQTGLVAGMMLGGLGGWLAERFTWSFAFSALGLPGLLYSVLLVFALRDAPRNEVGEDIGAEPVPPVHLGAALASLLSSGAFLLELAAVIVLGAGGWIIVGWLPTYVGEHFGLTQGVAGLSATGYLNGATAIGMIVGGVWTGRWCRTNLRSHLYVPAIGLCIAIPAMWVTANTSLFVTAMGGLIIFGITRTFFDVNLVPILCLVSDPRYRATGIGIISACSCITGGVMIYAVGALRDLHVDLSQVFSYLAVSLGLCVALILLIKIKPAPAISLPADGQSQSNAS